MLGRTSWAGLLVSATAILGAPALTIAQSTQPAPDTATGDTLTEIVVTAQKREQSILDTPLSISAIAGQDLLQSGVANLQDLNQSVPNVDIAQGNGSAHLGIRGISIDATQPGTDSQVAYFIDGVDVARPESQLDTFFDVDRLEIVRGPQGSLYGRNATGGAINVITKDPTDYFTANGQVTYGNYDLISTEAAVGGPLLPGVSGRLAVQTVDHSGYGTQGLPGGLPVVPNGPPNSFPWSSGLNNADTHAVRGKLKFEPTDNLTAVISADYFKEDDADNMYSTVHAGDQGLPVTDTYFGGVTAPFNGRDENLQYPENFEKKDWGLGATITWVYSPALTVTSITGDRETNFQQNWNGQTGTQLNSNRYQANEQAVQLTEELRASGTIGRFSYVAGAYYFHEDLEANTVVAFNGVTICGVNGTPFASIPPTLAAAGGTGCNLQSIDAGTLFNGYGVAGGLLTTSYAGFGQVSYEFTDQLGLDLGGRYTSDKVENLYENEVFDESTPYTSRNPLSIFNISPLLVDTGYRDVSDSKFTPKATLRYKPTPDLTTYVTYAEGYESGGYSVVSPGTPAYLPETLTDYEGGIKGILFDKRLSFDLAGYYYKYKNLLTTELNASGTALQVTNAGGAKLYGAELSLVAIPVDNVRLNLAVGLSHARYTQFEETDTDLVAPSPSYVAANDPWVGKIAANCPAAVSSARVPNFWSSPGSIGAVCPINLVGNHLQQAPDYNINLGAQYTWPHDWGNLTLRGEALFVDTIYFTPFNTSDLSQPAYHLFNASLGYEKPGANWYGKLWIKNIGDTYYQASMAQNSNAEGGQAFGVAGPPRTFGATVGFHF